MIGAFKNREEEKKYINEVISDMTLSGNLLGLSIVFCLTAIVGIIEYTLTLLESSSVAFSFNDSALIILMLLLNSTTIIMSFVSGVLYKSKIIKDFIVFVGLFIIFMVIVTMSLFNIVEDYLSLGVQLFVVFGLVIDTLCLIPASKEKKLKSRNVLFWIFAGLIVLFSVASILYMSFFNKWAITIINLKVAFAVYLVICLSYILFINLFNTTKVLKLKQLKHQYIREDISFEEVIRYIDLQVYTKPETEKDKEEEKNDIKLQIPKKRK